MAATTGRRSGMRREVGKVVCRNCTEKGHYANKYPAGKPIPEETWTKWCSLHETRSHSLYERDRVVWREHRVVVVPSGIGALAGNLLPQLLFFLHL